MAQREIKIHIWSSLYSKVEICFQQTHVAGIIMEYLWKAQEKPFKDPRPSISFVNKYCFALWDCIFIDVSTTSYQTLLVPRLHGEQGAVFHKIMKSAWICPVSFDWNRCHLHTSHYLRFTIDSEALKTGIFPHSPGHERKFGFSPWKTGNKPREIHHLTSLESSCRFGTWHLRLTLDPFWRGTCRAIWLVVGRLLWSHTTLVQMIHLLEKGRKVCISVRFFHTMGGGTPNSPRLPGWWYRAWRLIRFSVISGQMSILIYIFGRTKYRPVRVTIKALSITVIRFVGIFIGMVLVVCFRTNEPPCE